MQINMWKAAELQGVSSWLRASVFCGQRREGTGGLAGLGIGSWWRSGIAAEDTGRDNSLRTCTKTSEQSEPTVETGHQKSTEEPIFLVL